MKKKTKEQLQCEIKSVVDKVLNNITVSENSTGTAIRPNTLIPSEQRSQLDNLYQVLQNEYGEMFTIQFNQSSITISPRLTNTEFIYEGQEEKADKGDFDWAGNAAAMIGFFQKEGMQLDPLPEIILKKEPQTNGLLDPTGNYDPENNIIQVYTHGRHPRDVFSTIAHELVHCDQNHKGKLQNIHTENILKDNNLLDLEAEAYKKGRLLFRKWLGTLGCYEDK